MTNDGKNATRNRDVEPPREASATQARLTRDDRPKSGTRDRRTNWAWAHGGLGYDWMDSHYFCADLPGAPG